MEYDMTNQQTALGTIAAHVVSTDGNNIGCATVKVFDTQTKSELICEGKTDDSGMVALSVRPGNCWVTSEAYGKYDEKEVPVHSNCQTPVQFDMEADFALVWKVESDDGSSRTPRAGDTILAYVEDKLNVVKKCKWAATGARILERGILAEGKETHWEASSPGQSELQAICTGNRHETILLKELMMVGPARVVRVGGAVNIAMRRSASVETKDLPLWAVIRKSTEALSFKNYDVHMNLVLNGGRDLKTQVKLNHLKANRFLPFTDSDAYRLLKLATEAFVIVNCGVVLKEYTFSPDEDADVIGRTGVDDLKLNNLWLKYLLDVNGNTDLTVPYLALVGSKIPDDRARFSRADGSSGDSLDFVHQKLGAPSLVELIWSYWHEEAMLVQTMNAISMRFQNRRVHPADPLANMEISPLRPLNNILWGYIQDEQHRLTVLRRVYEYDHEYGLSLEGRAVPAFRGADSRSQFLQAFHNLLYLSSEFFKKDDNTMVLSDAFPVLNSLKEVHLILSQGAHNQFGDLPVTARVEMLMQQWLLARPEFGEFLPTRAMVAYPEPWMDRVDAMKKLQGWSDVNVLHFRDLGVFGEQLLLSIRFGSWADVSDPDQAKNWLRLWRPQIQGYMHAYRAVTGADITTEPVNSTLPSVLLARRLAQQPRLRSC